MQESGKRIDDEIFRRNLEMSVLQYGYVGTELTEAAIPT